MTHYNILDTKPGLSRASYYRAYKRMLARDDLTDLQLEAVETVYHVLKNDARRASYDRKIAEYNARVILCGT